MTQKNEQWIVAVWPLHPEDTTDVYRAVAPRLRPPAPPRTTCKIPPSVPGGYRFARRAKLATRGMRCTNPCSNHVWCVDPSFVISCSVRCLSFRRIQSGPPAVTHNAHIRHGPPATRYPRTWTSSRLIVPPHRRHACAFVATTARAVSTSPMVKYPHHAHQPRATDEPQEPSEQPQGRPDEHLAYNASPPHGDTSLSSRSIRALASASVFAAYTRRVSGSSMSQRMPGRCRNAGRTTNRPIRCMRHRRMNQPPESMRYSYPQVSHQ